MNKNELSDFRKGTKAVKRAMSEVNKRIDSGQYEEAVNIMEGQTTALKEMTGKLRCISVQTKPYRLDTAAHSIKQIADDDGEPMIEAVVNSDCSVADIDEIHAEALEINELYDYALYTVCDDDNQFMFWQLNKHDQQQHINICQQRALEMNSSFKECA